MPVKVPPQRKSPPPVKHVLAVWKLPLSAEESVVIEYRLGPQPKDSQLPNYHTVNHVHQKPEEEVRKVRRVIEEILAEVYGVLGMDKIIKAMKRKNYKLDKVQHFCSDNPRYALMFAASKSKKKPMVEELPLATHVFGQGKRGKSKPSPLRLMAGKNGYVSSVLKPTCGPGWRFCRRCFSNIPACLQRKHKEAVFAMNKKVELRVFIFEWW